MVAKSIVEIDVQDERFLSFLEKFSEYKKALEDLPEQWRGAAQGIGESAKETERVRNGTEALAKAFNDGVASIASINDGLDRLNGNLEKANKNQSQLSKNSSGARKFLNQASKDAKSLAGHIKDATTSLLSWGAVLGLFSGLAGAGGLWGMNRLAGNASAQRFTALGLGTTAGGLSSSAINYQKALGNPTGTLGAIRDAQLDLGKRWQFNAMGINNPNQDPAKLLPEMIRSARDIFVRNGSTQQGAEAYGLTNFFTLDDLNRFKNMSDAEIDAMAKQAQKDTQRLQLTDQQLKQWQDFNVQLDRSSASISNTFIRGLAPLTPELTKLSDAFSGAIDTVLKSPELGKWIDGLSSGIRKFSEYLVSPDFKTDVKDFMEGVEKLGRVIKKVIGWISGDSSISADDIKSSSSILSDKPATDPKTGQSYTPGSDNDPNVWPWLKAVRGFFDKSENQPEQHAQAAKRKPQDKYDRYFEEAAKKYDLDPRLLKAVAGAESSWNKNAVSRAGAQGLMQVMPFNFKRGEDPFNPRDNIMAGARTMAWAKGQAGGDSVEMLRWYNGGKNRGSKENREYPSRVRDQYLALYGHQSADGVKAAVANQISPQGNGKTDQILQQILDNQKRSNAQGMVVYNNTGGSAIVASTQIGGFG
ncbi:MAG: lytic transglycosylase domain-containing protein [Acinetobacter sp.]